MTKTTKVDTSRQYIVEFTEQRKLEVRCTAEHPCKEKWLQTADGRIRVFHPEAEVVDVDGSVGWEHKYSCPYCGLKWWVECDG